LARRAGTRTSSIQLVLSRLIGESIQREGGHRASAAPSPHLSAQTPLISPQPGFKLAHPSTQALPLASLCSSPPLATSPRLAEPSPALAPIPISSPSQSLALTLLLLMPSGRRCTKRSAIRGRSSTRRRSAVARRGLLTGALGCGEFRCESLGVSGGLVRVSSGFGWERCGVAWCGTGR
jgi:hypothetical protein